MCIPCFIEYYVKAFSKIFIIIGAPHFYGYIPPLIRGPYPLPLTLILAGTCAALAFARCCTPTWFS